jgi:hypothetical protein
MENKFHKVPVEEDTRIIFQQEVKLGKYDVLYQKWSWCGITAESVIFANEDIAELEEEQIIKEVKSSPLINQDSEATFKKSNSGFTFVNFNFESE